MIPVTPRGFKDVLPDEARWRESISTKVQHVLSSWGYAPIETPTLEVLDVLEQGGRLAEPPFRLFDSDGALLVLRPDVTLPVARLVASRLSRDDGPAGRPPAGRPVEPAAPRPARAVPPLRFRYVQPVFREEESLRGQAREFTQIGIEAIGPFGPAADAEVVLLMRDALKACGLADFTIAICTVGVLRELLDVIVREAEVGPSWRDEVLAACHLSNAVELAALADDPRVERRYGQALKELSGLRGGSDAIRRCQELVGPLGCTDGLDALAKAYEIVEKVGAAGQVTVDFSVMSAFDYYTGLVFVAYAPRLGVPLGAGGRYDRMLEAYGAKAPAAGFAFSLERVMTALAEQGVAAAVDILDPPCVSVEVDADAPAAAFAEAARLRAAGTRAVLVQPGDAHAASGRPDAACSASRQAEEGEKR